MSDKLLLMQDTERSEYGFAVKDLSEKRAWIAAEPSWRRLPTFEKMDIHIGFELNDESYENAKEVARFMDKHIKNIVIW